MTPSQQRAASLAWIAHFEAHADAPRLRHLVQVLSDDFVAPRLADYQAALARIAQARQDPFGTRHDAQRAARYHAALELRRTAQNELAVLVPALRLARLRLAALKGPHAGDPWQRQGLGWFVLERALRTPVPLLRAADTSVAREDTRRLRLQQQALTRCGAQAARRLLERCPDLFAPLTTLEDSLSSTNAVDVQALLRRIRSRVRLTESERALVEQLFAPALQAP